MYDIPKIPVFVVEDGALGTNQGYFDTEEFIIKVEESIPRNKLIHEWVHYAICLINNVQDLEENICTWAPVGIEEDAEGSYPILHKLLKKLPEEDEEDETDAPSSETI